MTLVKSALIAASTIALFASAAKAADDVVIVYDASGSMWGQIDGTSKIEIAREVMTDLVNGWDENSNLGLVAYGHRRQGDCTDIETLITPAALDKAAFIKTVNAIKPNGKTPISAAVQHAADLLSYRDNPATVVLISDGVETCNADPCALSAQLAKQGVKFTTHVVGFDLKDDENASLSCIAENTGGVFVPASNAAELKDALAQVQSAMDQQPPVIEPEPEPEPQPVADVALTGPAQVVRGAVFDVRWSPTFDKQDFVTIVPAGAKEGTYANYLRTDGKTEGQLTASPDVGLYELRYVREDGRITLGSMPIEVIEAEVTVTGPAQVATGAAFDVSWTGTVNKRDYVTIVPAGAKEGVYADYVRTDTNTEGQITAPATPGLYELRYVLDEGGKTLATAPIEVVEPEVTVTGPAQVTTGAQFDVSWAGAVNPRDFITIVPSGAKEGTYADYVRIDTKTEGQLTAPAEPGFYELRYVLEEGRKTLTSAGIEVVSPEVGISGPVQVATGAEFDVSWAGAVNPRDYITIVPAGSKEGTYADYVRTDSKTEGQLTAPPEPGLYELRYVLEEGRKTLASIAIEVTEPSLTLNGPTLVRAGTAVAITWSETVNRKDYLTIVPAGADEGSYADYIRAGNATAGDLKAPTEPGLYEIRYVLETGRKTLATIPLEVVPADAPLDDGAGLSVPPNATTGETITVTWTGGSDSPDQRIAVARKDQPDLSWVTVQSVAGEKTMQLTMPDEAGLYEVRYLDVTKRQLLGRSVIEVK